MKTPQVSLQIRLSTVSPLDGGWKDPQLDFLYDVLVGKTVFVSVANCYQRVDNQLVASVYLLSKSHMAGSRFQLVSQKAF